MAKKISGEQEKFNKWMDGLYESLSTYAATEASILTTASKVPEDTSQRLANLQLALYILKEHFWSD